MKPVFKCLTRLDRLQLIQHLVNFILSDIISLEYASKFLTFQFHKPSNETESDSFEETSHSTHKDLFLFIINLVSIELLLGKGIQNSTFAKVPDVIASAIDAILVLNHGAIATYEHI